METKITKTKKESRNNKTYPLVLLVEMNERDKNNLGMTFNFKYKLRIDKKNKKIEGKVESLGMSSSNALDDEDAANYSRDAERMSVLEVEKYLRKKFGKLETNIETTYGTLFSLNIGSRI